MPNVVQIKGLALFLANCWHAAGEMSTHVTEPTSVLEVKKHQATIIPKISVLVDLVTRDYCGIASAF